MLIVPQHMLINGWRTSTSGEGLGCGWEVDCAFLFNYQIRAIKVGLW